MKKLNRYINIRDPIRVGVICGTVSGLGGLVGSCFPETNDISLHLGSVAAATELGGLVGYAAIKLFNYIDKVSYEYYRSKEFGQIDKE